MKFKVTATAYVFTSPHEMKVNFLDKKLIYDILKGCYIKRKNDFHYFNMDSCTTFFNVGHMLIRFVRTKRSCDPSPLRTVSCIVQPWLKSIKFVGEENEQQEGALPKDEDREEKVNFIE